MLLLEYSFIFIYNADRFDNKFFSMKHIFYNNYYVIKTMLNRLIRCRNSKMNNDILIRMIELTWIQNKL